MSQTVLLVEDSKVFVKIITPRIEEALGFEVVCAQSYGEAKTILESKQHTFFAALLDLGLPDAPNGEVVDLVSGYHIPSIVFTGDYSEEAQEFMWTNRVVDYVIKEWPHSVAYVVQLLDRLQRNGDLTVLVVDDSKTARAHMRKLLEAHCFKVVEAENAQGALTTIKNSRMVKCVVLDYNMPGMDGFELTKEIRKKHGMDSLAIIGISGEDDHRLSARFIKYGANDFIAKPFLHEQFYCRITQNVSLIEQFDKIRQLSFTDPLTQLRNRRAFFEAGGALYKRAKRDGTPMVLAMMDVDHFKSVNDNHGHKAGDMVLQQIANMLMEHFRESDVTARLGGEEFCVLAAGVSSEEANHVFDKFREKLASTPVDIPNGTLDITMSIGLCDVLHDDLDAMIHEADERLYSAKEQGRNRVVGP